MANSYIALIFPEYDDVDNVVTSQDWKRDDLPNDNTLGAFIKHLVSFIDFYEDEECYLMYDAKNVLSFTYGIRGLPECYPGRERELRFALKNLENWRKNRKSSEDDLYNLNYSNIKDEMRVEIATRMSNNPEDSFLLTVHIPNYTAKEWRLSKGHNTYCIESVPLSIKEVFEWMASHHHPQRSYNWNPKHGEYGKGAHPTNNGDEVSVLLCSRDHAAEIIHKAVGEPMYDTLYCYDTDFGKYMEFKADCKYEHLQDRTKRNYHSYHLSEESAIPHRIKKKLDILTML